MCTLIVVFQVHADAPLLVAANRDELLTRPAGPPRRFTHQDMLMVAPEDLEAGGTWLGVNRAGVFVGITNRFGVERNPRARSRGQLVLDALSAPTADDAFAAAAKLDPTRESGFHLVMADRSAAHLVTCDRARLEARTLPPGRHVITERSFGAGVTTRESSISSWLDRRSPESGHRQSDASSLAGRGGVREQAGGPSALPHGVGPRDARDARGARGARDARDARGALDALGRLLATHAEDGFEGVCVHVPAHGYGTRSSSLIALNADGTTTYLHAPGPPCTTAYEAVPADAWLAP